MSMPIVNKRCAQNYLKNKAKLKCYTELENFVKEILDSSVEKATPKLKQIKRKQLYQAIVEKADSLKKFAGAVGDDPKEKKITAEELIEDFDLFVLNVKSFIKIAKDPVTRLEILNEYLDSEVEIFKKEFFNYISQIKTTTH